MGIENGHGSQLVQDHIEVSEHATGSSNVPVKLHTLLVRTPGRVTAASDFIDKCLSVVGFGACGDGDDIERDPVGEGRSVTHGHPSKEFLSARAAALRTLENYFAGNIDDELLVEAEFRIDREKFAVRFTGQVDGDTGRVRDPVLSPTRGQPSPMSVSPVVDQSSPMSNLPAPISGIICSRRPEHDPIAQEVVTVEGRDVVLPIGVSSDLIKHFEPCVEPGYLRSCRYPIWLVFKNENRMLINSETGKILN